MAFASAVANGHQPSAMSDRCPWGNPFGAEARVKPFGVVLATSNGITPTFWRDTDLIEWASRHQGRSA